MTSSPNQRMLTVFLCLICTCCAMTSVSLGQVAATQPLVTDAVVFAEKDGLLAVEAEHFVKQTKTEKRQFYLTHSKLTPGIKPDGDPSHVGGASGGAYLEILPDTRRTHGDKLIRGTNFAPEAGKMAVLHYNVNISTPGRYYVWVRAHSTGSEDNGLHVGIDGEWPASGQRLQWCVGKHQWRWESKQRTEKQHCGEPYKIYLDIKDAGKHTIHFSMREDGFEFDKWLMTTKRNFQRPNDVGPATAVLSGELPPSFPYVKPSAVAAAPKQTLQISAKQFADGKMRNYYVDSGKWLAVNPEQHQQGLAQVKFPFPSGVYHVTLLAVGENDGRSKYEVSIGNQNLGEYTPPLSTKMFAEGEKFNRTWKNIKVAKGSVCRVVSKVGSADGMEYSRARWRGLAFVPANADTRKLARPFLTAQRNQAGDAKSAPQTSPTKPSSPDPLQQPRGADGDGTVSVSGDLKLWHKVTLNYSGPFAHEKDNIPNPFTDFDMRVQFKHTSGKTYTVPGYFAADGNAANSSAESGNVWRAHFSPDKLGTWSYKVLFHQAKNAALATTLPGDAKVVSTGQLEVGETNLSGRDLRAHGRLQYVGKRYLQFAGSKKYFLKVGADAPETLLAFADFDNTIAGNAKKAPIKTWGPHVGDWNAGDPVWQSNKGKGLIGAINYLSGKGCNAFSFLTYNAGGDGDNVWPFIQREDKLHYDCSKLDQWGIVFDHGTQRGMYLHFKLQETENDDHRKGKSAGSVPECLDGGNLGPQRKLYLRELIARFGHNLALNWNLGEENTQSPKQQREMIDYIAAMDAYDHNIVVHTFPDQQDKVYSKLIGQQSKLTGVSLQNSSLQTTHAQTVKWVNASEAAGKPWVVAFDESGSAAHAQCPDLGYKGFDGRDNTGKMVYNQHQVRKQTLWGVLMAGGAGNEYYFGYKFAENDIVCQDWRSRDQSWDYCRIAINFFHDNNLPFWDMKNADELVGNPQHAAGKFCFALPGKTYVVYLPEAKESELDLRQATGTFAVTWFNPRTGGEMQSGSVETVGGGRKVKLGQPPADADEDWVVIVRRQ